MTKRINLKSCQCAKWDCETNKNAVCPSHKSYHVKSHKDWRDTADL